MQPDGLYHALITGCLFSKDWYRPLFTTLQAAGDGPPCPDEPAGGRMGSFVVLVDTSTALPSILTTHMPVVTTVDRA
eukprot:SAG11_NODE_2631_length_3155_cov_2.254908_6_plen_76_part_01